MMYTYFFIFEPIQKVIVIKSIMGLKGFYVQLQLYQCTEWKHNTYYALSIEMYETRGVEWNWNYNHIKGNDL